MKKEKLIIVTSFLFILIIFLLSFNSVYADTLNLNITSNKEEIKNGEEIIIKVSWNKEMQAADYFLNYDAKKLEYVKSDIDDVYISNDVNQGIIKTAWFSMDDSKKTSIEYTFKVKNEGQLKFTTSINGGFATENMEVPEDYKDGELVIESSENNSFIFIILGGVIFVSVVSFVIFKSKRKNKKIQKG